MEIILKMYLSARQFVNGTFNRRGEESIKGLFIGIVRRRPSIEGNEWFYFKNKSQGSFGVRMNADLRTVRPIQWGSVNKSSSFYKKAYRVHKYLRHIEQPRPVLSYV